MKTFTRTGALVLALFLLCGLAPAPAWAQGADGPAPAAAAADAAPDTAETAGEENAGAVSAVAESAGEENAGDAQAASVSTWAELTAWLDANWRTGGTVRLDADVTARGSYDLMSGKQAFRIRPLTVDCGEHTIYIDGGPGEIVSLTGTNFMLTIRGRGGQNGLLQVRPGGSLLLDMLTLEAREGAAVVQGEGGVLVVTQTDKGYEAPPRVTGQLLYAEKPVLTYQNHASPSLAAVPDGQPLTQALLPETAQAALNYRGVLSGEIRQPVVWDLETDAPRIARRLRTTLAGRPAGAVCWNGQTWPEGAYTVHGAPACTAAFLEDGAALLELRLEATKQVLVGSVAFRVEPGAQTLRLLTSADEGASWTQQAAQDDAGGVEEGDFTLYLEAPAYPVWLLVEAVYPDGRVIHTDTVSVDESQVTPATWLDGHRGGGEPVLPVPEPEAPEPDSQAPDAQNPDAPGLTIPSNGAAGTPQGGNGGGETGGAGTVTVPSAGQQAQAPAQKASGAQKAAAPQSAAPDGASAPQAAGGQADAPDATDASTPIVSQADSAVQPESAAPAPQADGGRQAAGGLSPAAQAALGGAAAAVLVLGALLYCNPKPLQRMRQRLAKRLRRK